MIKDEFDKEVNLTANDLSVYLMLYLTLTSSKESKDSNDSDSEQQSEHFFMKSDIKDVMDAFPCTDMRKNISESSRLLTLDNSSRKKHTYILHK